MKFKKISVIIKTRLRSLGKNYRPVSFACKTMERIVSRTVQIKDLLIRIFGYLPYMGVAREYKMGVDP